MHAEVSWSIQLVAQHYICIHMYLKMEWGLVLLFFSSLFTYSDNGAWTEKGLDGGSNGLLRGQKGETWEGGMRYVYAITYFMRLV